MELVLIIAGLVFLIIGLVLVLMPGRNFSTKKHGTRRQMQKPDIRKFRILGGVLLVCGLVLAVVSMILR